MYAYRTNWMITVNHHMKTGEDKLLTTVADRRACRKERSNSIKPEMCRCDFCNKDCHSRIGLFSYKQRCCIPARRYDVSPMVICGSEPLPLMSLITFLITANIKISISSKDLSHACLVWICNVIGLPSEWADVTSTLLEGTHRLF